MLKYRNNVVAIALAAVLAGCGGSGGGSSVETETPPPPPPSAVTGDLEVNVVGLPIGVQANVVITGPNNFSQTINQSQTLTDLTAGEYSITVSPSDNSGITYDVLPMARQVTVDAQGASETLIFQAPTVSEGIISNFGSVFVNGVRFDTADAMISTDDFDDTTEDELDIGMVVTVTGRSSADGSNAQASEIQFRATAEGPIERISLADEVVQVLGQVFRLDELTQFPTRSFEQLIVGETVEISALQNQVGDFIATRIELEDDAEADFRLRGVISNLNEQQQSFEVNGLTVDFSNADVDGILMNGGEVSVTAETAIVAQQFNATEVEALGDEDNDIGRQQAIDGIISEVVSSTQIRVDDYTINIDESTEFEIGSSANLLVNVRVRVFGFMTDEDILTAQSIRIDLDSDITLTGRLESIDSDDNSVEVLGNEYELDEHSILQDLSEASVRQVTLDQLSVGDLVEISAFEGDDDLLIRQMSRLSINTPDANGVESVELEGLVTAIGDQSFSIQDVLVSVGAFTEFDFDDDELTLEQFINTLSIGDNVEIEGVLQADNSIVATAVELENEEVSENSNVVELEGDISDVLSNAEFTLNGRQILIDAQTEFDDGNESSLIEGNSVEVRGRESEEGQILAIRIEFDNLDGQDSDDDVEVEFEGNIDSVVSATQIIVSGQTVDVTDETEFENGSVDDLAEMVFVEIEGNLTTDGTVEATNIEFEDADSVEVSGQISSFISSTQFFIGDQEISTNNDTEFENGNSSGLLEGVFLEVDGELVNEVLVAEEIEFENIESIEIEGTVSSGVSENQFTIGEQPVLINEFTVFEDGDVNDIEVGTFLSIEGRLNGEGILVAESIEFPE